MESLEGSSVDLQSDSREYNKLFVGDPPTDLTIKKCKFCKKNICLAFHVHNKICSALNRRCEHCNLFVNINAEHLCDKEIVSCSYSDQGCLIHLPREELSEHIETCKSKPYRCKKCSETMISAHIYFHETYLCGQSANMRDLYDYFNTD